MPKLNDALSFANSCGNVEVWVADGIYYPDEGVVASNNSQASTFHLFNGVEVYGGFVGTETARNQRDLVNNLTILSGDLTQNDGVDGNGVVTDTANIAGNNAFHVVKGSSVNETADLDGSIITAGRANGLNDNRHGGGLFVVSGSPTIQNVTFRGNYAQNNGGGVFLNGGSATLQDVTFWQNRATRWGGGMYSVVGDATIADVGTDLANGARLYGTTVDLGAYERGGNPELDLAVRAHEPMRRFLAQNMNEACSLEDSRSGLTELVEGLATGMPASAPESNESLNNGTG